MKFIVTSQKNPSSTRPPDYLIKGYPKIDVDEFRRLTVDENVAEMTISQTQNVADDTTGGHASSVAKTLLVPAMELTDLMK